MPRAKLGVGLVGCGNISAAYLRNLPRFDNVKVVACADIDLQRARGRAAEFGVPRACAVEDLLARPDIDLVVNLTVPLAHAEVALAAVRAGKSVYNEKPFAVERADGARLLAEARRRGVLVGGAPDTFLGAAGQTARALVDGGAIGEPVGIAGWMMGRGHEGWHPNPAFYYERGGGPMFDMGPYYLTAMVALLGPVRRVTGSARASFKERVVTSQPLFGQKIRVRVPTHVMGTLEFAGGPIGTMAASFDVWASASPPLQLFGSEGSLIIPDPNGFGGEVLLWRPDSGEWRPQPLSHRYEAESRGLGAADMARALQTGRPARASGELAFHVLDVMHAFHDAARTGKRVSLRSRCARPSPMNPGRPEGRLD